MLGKANKEAEPQLIKIGNKKFRCWLLGDEDGFRFWETEDGRIAKNPSFGGKTEFVQKTEKEVKQNEPD